ncbi:hypothetical protein LTV02_11205 [Nocardia yamanashiensis]|uniref:hypothetical protein n=1 Tax=Nocardia yamanashiensis TaxID=209247 RepID=UPI001E2D1E59|nr:hypothetical protein [Nocardia yamanashiensis]UGT43911.1 hypothetical protein LTV02_11205 [Nocardia yamanashiensis]
MTIDISSRAMVSDLTPEFAFRAHGFTEEVWRLSWLPEHRLTWEQAWAGMELDEILSDPHIVDDHGAHATAADRAARLGIGVEHAVLVLARRMAERMHQDTGVVVPLENELPGASGGGRSAAALAARSRHP